MARLTNAETGTVVRVEGELEEAYRAQGWADVELDEKPAAKRSSKK